MTITANVAYKIAALKKKKQDKETLESIYKSIAEAARQGNMELLCPKVLSEKVILQLKKLDFKVTEEFVPFCGMCSIINWGKGEDNKDDKSTGSLEKIKNLFKNL
jgi:CO dehydrogenase/acetyl-CoA synthase alpha subunit